MIDVLKGIDRALGAIFEEGYGRNNIIDIKEITHGGVLTTICFSEIGNSRSYTDYFYEVTVLLPFSTISRDSDPTTISGAIKKYADDNATSLGCGPTADSDDGDNADVRMITIIDIEPHTDTPIIIGQRRYTVGSN